MYAQFLRELLQILEDVSLATRLKEYFQKDGAHFHSSRMVAAQLNEYYVRLE